VPLQSQRRNLPLEVFPQRSVAHEHKAGFRELASDRNSSVNQPGMALNVAVHVSHQHDPFFFFYCPALVCVAAYEPSPVSRAVAEFLHVHAVVNNANFSRSKVVLRQHILPHRIRVGQHNGTKILHTAQPHPPPGLVQVEMRKIALAGNDHRNPCDHRRWDAQQVRIQIVSVNNPESAPAQENCQTKHLVHPVYRIEPALGIEFANGDGCP